MKKLYALLLVPTLALGGEPVGERLAWMLGCWSTTDRSAIEVWAVDDKQTLVGFSVVIRNNAVAFYEILTIRQDVDDTLTYTARPSGQVETTFLATQLSKNSVVFENPVHDYPQQITYVRDGTRLDATIALIGGGNPNSFNKVACPDH